MNSLTDLLSSAIDTAGTVFNARLAANAAKPAPVAQSNKLPAWLLPVGIGAAVLVVIVLIFRGK